MNKRIQLFDQNGTFLEEWKQFGEASGLYIFPDDTLYVTDWQDKKAIFIGSAKDGSIRETIERAHPRGRTGCGQAGQYLRCGNTARPHRRHGHRIHHTKAGEELT